MNQEKMGMFIRKLRNEKKMTQQELADKIGVTDRAISKWENGRGAPDITLLIPLSNELEITVLELLTGEKINDQNKAVVGLIKQTNKTIKLWKYLFLSIINLLLITMILISFNGYIVPKRYENDQKQGITRILSDSMYPTFKAGEGIIYDKTSIDNVKENDLVLFVYQFSDDNNSSSSNDTISLHRVTKIIKDEEGNINLVTKGDNNSINDESYVTKSNFIGIYNHKSPWLTNLFLKNNSK